VLDFRDALRVAQRNHYLFFEGFILEKYSLGVVHFLTSDCTKQRGLYPSPSWEYNFGGSKMFPLQIVQIKNDCYPIFSTILEDLGPDCFQFALWKPSFLYISPCLDHLKIPSFFTLSIASIFGCIHGTLNIGKKITNCTVW